MNHKILNGGAFSRKNRVAKGPLTRSQSKSHKTASKTTTRLKTLKSKPLSIRTKTKSLRSQLNSIKNKSDSLQNKSKLMGSQLTKNVTAKSRRHVIINTPENEVLEYTLGTSEKEWKQDSINRRIPKCKNPKRQSDFPCRYKRTIFKTKTAYNNWQDLKYHRNISTGYKSRSEHYDDIDFTLLSRGEESLLRK
jgi:hypothetical protein